MKHLIIYHANCNDGFGAAWAAWRGLKASGEVELFAASYGKEPPWEKINKDTEVHIVDFSYTPEVMILLCEVSKHVTWLDHHISAISAWAEYAKDKKLPFNIVHTLSTKNSGVMLAWNFYNSGEKPPLIITHIQDRDIWEFKISGTKEVHLNLNTQHKDLIVWDELIESCDKNLLYYTKFIAEGAAIDRYYQQLVQNIIATNKVEVFIDGIKGLACNCPGALASDVGHHLATESGTFGFTWEETKEGKEKCSLRSNEDYDVSKIAKSFGGGGHKNAAGFELDIKSANAERIHFKSLCP